ncbi:MAG: proton-conducting transporter membrane subunit [Candidatus Dormibacteria bacterium]
MVNPNGTAVFATMLPTAMLVVLAGVVALLGWLRPGLPPSFHRWLGSIALAGAAIAALITFHALGHTEGVGLIAYAGAVVADRFDAYAVLLLCGAGLLATLTSGAAAARLGPRMPAYQALVLTATAAGTVIAVQWEMAMLVVGLGLLVVSLIGMVALEKTAEPPGEAAFQALTAAGVALALLLYGLAIIYGATGTTDLAATRDQFVHAAPLEGLGLALTLLGLAFLVGAPPLHRWLLQVAAASSGAVAGAVISLAAVAGGIALVRVMVSGFSSSLRPWVVLAAVLASAACLYPAILSLVAGNVRRLIALGACLQGGLLLTALVGSGLGLDFISAGGVIALLFGLLVFVLALQVSFQAVARLEADGIGTGIDDIRGLGRRSPLTAALLALGLAGMAGLPPLAGMVARILIAETAVAVGYAWVAVAAVVASVIYAVPVLRWIAAVLVEDDDQPAVASSAPWLPGLVGAACVVFGIVAFVLAGPLLFAANGAASALR